MRATVVLAGLVLGLSLPSASFGQTEGMALVRCDFITDHANSINSSNVAIPFLKSVSAEVNCERKTYSVLSQVEPDFENAPPETWQRCGVKKQRNGTWRDAFTGSAPNPSQRFD